MVERAQGIKGSSLAIVLIFLAVFVVMSSTIAQLLQVRTTFSAYHAARARALTVAESGLTDALQILADTPSWTAGYSDKGFEEGFYTVTLDTSGAQISVLSEGRIPAGVAYKTEVRRRVWATLSGFDKVCSTTSQDMDIDDASSCAGNVYSSRDIDVKDASTITGNAAAGRNINLSGGGSVSGTKNSDNYPPAAAAIAFPTFQTDVTYKNQALVGGTHVGDYTIDGVTTTLGPLYITGDLKIKDAAVVTLTGTVFVKKKIDIDESQVKGKYTLYAQDELDVKESTTGAGDLGPLMISEKDITIDESTVYRSIVYSTNNGVTMQKSSVTGMVIGKDLDVKDNSTVTWKNITDLDVKLTGSTASNWGSN